MTDLTIEPRVDARLPAAFCTNFCQPFLLSVIDWLDFPDDGTWRLLWFLICEESDAAVVWSGKTANYELKCVNVLNGEQHWVHKDFWPLVVVWEVISGKLGQFE